MSKAGRGGTGGGLAARKPRSEARHPSEREAVGVAAPAEDAPDELVQAILRSRRNVRRGAGEPAPGDVESKPRGPSRFARDHGNMITAMPTIDRRSLVALGAAALLHTRLGRGSGAGVPSKEIKTAGIRLIPVDGKYKVWTKKLGAGPIKMLTLHGGPGVTHEYFECFEDFLPQAGVEFWYYDQLGSFYSDQPDDPSLWTIDRFREEVEQVRKGLGKDMLATLEKYEAAGQYDAPEYLDAMYKGVYGRHVCRIDPWPDPVARAFKHINNQVYGTMQGPNEFVVTGTFKDWDRWKDLPRITVPTLLIGGRYDEMDPQDIRKMGRLIPNSRTVICDNGSHLAMWDDQEAYFDALIPFLQDVEKGRFRAPAAASRP
jgi:proline iminopeptidase